MRIAIMSVMVDDQEKALQFYTTKLGFTKKHDIPMGEHRWLTLVSPEGHPDVELLLEPSAHPAASPFRKALYDDKIAAAAFAVDDTSKEHKRLNGLGVRFTTPPTPAGPTTIAVFDDTCGNLIQIFEPAEG